MTPLLFTAREGHIDAARALLDAGADVNQPRDGDQTTPLLMAAINGHFDLAKLFLDRGADPPLAGENGATPLYAVLNCVWAQKSNYPQPRGFTQQKLTYLEIMTALLDKGADPNARLKKKVWYSGYNSDLSGVDESGATPFWRAAYASDVDAMRLLHGARRRPERADRQARGPAAVWRLDARGQGRLRAAAGAGGWSVGHAAHGRHRRRLRRRVCRQLAHHSCRGLDAGGQVSRRGDWRRRQRQGSPGQHRASQCRRRAATSR